VAVKFRKHTSISDEIPSASMSDIAFLLLIFFLVTTVFNIEEGIKLSLPGQAQIQKIHHSNLMVVRITADGFVLINKQLIAVTQVEQLVKDALDANPKLVVLLITHENADYGLMVDVMDELKQAGATRISLKTSTTKGAENI